MRSEIWYSLAHYLTYFILISLSNEVPLSGKNVRDAKPNELPFVVSIQRISGISSHFCFGTLISQKSVLTAAHCLVGEDIDKISILVGTNALREGKRYRARSWISYWQWTNNVTNRMVNNKYNEIVDDIAVITLKRKVKEVNAAAILTFVREELTGQKVRIAGWGRNDDGTRLMILQTGVVKVLSNKACEDKINFWLPHGSEVRPVAEKFFCTSIDPWVLIDPGDSGAPVLNKHNQVVGVALSAGSEAFKKIKSTSKDIVRSNLVNIHLHLYRYRKFINDVK